MNKSKKSEKKFVFFDIDGVLTPTAEFIPGKAPKLTKVSEKILKIFSEKGFILVFITARSAYEVRMKGSIEETLKKNNLLKNSIIYTAAGLDEVTVDYEFKTNNGKMMFKNGNAVVIKKPIVKRETFGEIDKFLLFKMLLGKEIKQLLKYEGFKIKPAIGEELLNDSRIFFQLENNTLSERKKFFEEAKKILAYQQRIFKKTKKFGSPIELKVRDIGAGISIEPTELGKHIGVLKALRTCKVKPTDKITAYAFGDTESDRMMKIRKDIKFILVKNNKHFVKEAEKILKNIN